MNEKFLCKVCCNAWGHAWNCPGREPGQPFVHSGRGGHPLETLALVAWQAHSKENLLVRVSFRDWSQMQMCIERNRPFKQVERWAKRLQDYSFLMPDCSRLLAEYDPSISEGNGRLYADVHEEVMRGEEPSMLLAEIVW